LFHLVTGRVPYGGNSVAEAMRRHANSRIPLPAPESLNDSLTSGLGAIVRKGGPSRESSPQEEDDVAGDDHEDDRERCSPLDHHARRSSGSGEVWG
jgi:serine/threonine-protein kinase